jgi:hypothetical protein
MTVRFSDMKRRKGGPLATLWRLAWNEDQLSCMVYRDGDGLQMRLESSTNVILTEPFELRPRVLSRMHALRNSLKRRGWTDVAG